jgi:hypothetical protein
MRIGTVTKRTVNAESNSSTLRGNGTYLFVRRIIAPCYPEEGGAGHKERYVVRYPHGKGAMESCGQDVLRALQNSTRRKRLDNRLECE